MTITEQQIQKLERLLVGFSWATRSWANDAQHPHNKPWPYDIEEKSKKIAAQVAEIAGYQPGKEEPVENGWPNYDPKKRAEILALPQYPEIQIHLMGLVGWVYRNLKYDWSGTVEKVFELARLCRECGAWTMRTFMTNGSRAKTELYMLDALPWKTVIKDGRKLHDFSQVNSYYWECCEVIERANKYWQLKHEPTFWMARQNQDIFRRDNNVQGIHGFRDQRAFGVRTKFNSDYIQFQRLKYLRGEDYLPCCEFENEPNHHGNHEEGAVIAEQHLGYFLDLEPLGLIIPNTRTCGATSEFPHAELVERHYFKPLDRFFGNDRFNRKVKVDNHGVSTLQSLFGWTADEDGKTQFEKALGSAWPRLCYNEDAANDGSYSPIPWTGYRQANYEELFDTVWYGTSECRKRGKKFFFTVFMMDCLEQDPEDGIAKETYTLEEMDWKRAKAPLHALEDLKRG